MPKNVKGLSAEEAAARLQKYGYNLLPQKSGEAWWKKLLRQFGDLMVIILIIASGIAFVLDEKVDAVLIFGIVVLNGLIGFFQEWKSEKTLEALQKMVSPEATVLRDGKEILIEARFLVRGDLIILREGDRIPADGRILENYDLQVEEAALTGESEPVRKDIDAPVFLGTAVVSGSATVEITATGAATRFGNVAKLTLTTTPEKSPLQKELLRIGMFVGKLAGILIVAVFLMDFLANEGGFAKALLFSISVAVAAVPEGLPATITIALALGVQRLAKKNAVIKQLSSAETLGATTVICSDKTGTITENRLRVTEIFLAEGEKIICASKGGDDALQCESTFWSKATLASLQTFLQIAVLCNDAKLSREKEKDGWRVLGDPTEGALLLVAQEFKSSGALEKSDQFSLLKKFPFDSRRKMMSTWHRDPNGDDVLLVKGAPEMLLEKCAFYAAGNKILPLTALKRKEFLKAVEQMSSKALRVLGFASRQLQNERPQSTAEAEQKLVFHGLAGMMDAPRLAVPDAVQAAHEAGIRIIMITGDNPKTAEAIARKVGIFSQRDARAFTGDDLEKMSDHKLSAVLFARIPQSEKKSLKETPYVKYREMLFARVSPEHKLRIVKLLQKGGEVVAVTGDGVNDAPALKKANIGVAMGIAGTEVSKEAAHMILLDDSFATIVEAIREGRKIFENLRKFIWFLFSGNIGELIVIIGTLAVGAPNPLTAVLILVVNLGTDVLPATALSFEKAEAEVMKMPPRNPASRILNRKFVAHFFWAGALLAITTSGGFFWMLWHEGWTWRAPVLPEWHEKATGMAFAILVIGQMCIGLSARHFYASAFRNFFGNKFLLGAILLSLGIVAAVLYVPFLTSVFRTVPLSWSEVGVAILLASGVLWAEEIRKLIRRKLRPVKD